MANPLAHVITHRTGGIVGAPRRGTELGLERVLQSRYRIVEPIGTGGSSQVYLAQDTALNREVAIKVLDPAAAADGKTRGMFVKEARALAQLSHPNIVAVYDVGEVDGAPFIVMEHLPGGSLKQRIERGGAAGGAGPGPPPPPRAHRPPLPPPEGRIHPRPHAPHNPLYAD